MLKIVVSIKQGLGELTSGNLQIRNEKIFEYPLENHVKTTQEGMLVISECNESGFDWIDVLMVPYQMLNYCAVVDEPDDEEEDAKEADLFAHWDKWGDADYRCSACGNCFIKPDNYCHHCGRKMDKKGGAE